MRIIELSTKEREEETRQLFLQIKPFLDEGYSLNQSVKKVRGNFNTNAAWFRDLKEYLKREGYDLKNFRY